MIKIFLIIAVVVQTIASLYALRLVWATKYNAIWILFIIGFALLSVERLIQVVSITGGIGISEDTFLWLGVAISICMSIGVMYAHKLIRYIDRLNRQRILMQKRILTAVLRTEEKSRSRFSRELHDGLGPLLSSAKMSLSALLKEERASMQTEIINNTTYVIDEAIRSLREISNNLSPQVLNDFGLARGIENFVARSIPKRGTQIQFHTNLHDERFDADIEVILYRVICELINNSLKHAACTLIELNLLLRDEVLTLDYRDNGRGFDPTKRTNEGMGLSNIASRVHAVNGTCHITGTKGQGMQAHICIGINGENVAQIKHSRDWVSVEMEANRDVDGK
jgi:signal transduction histidine kinase